MGKEVVQVRRAATAAALRTGRQNLEHQRRLAAITAEETVAKAEIAAAVSILNTAAAQPQNATVSWLLNRYFKN